MIMPGRSWVAGIDIATNYLLQIKSGLLLAEGGPATFSTTRIKHLFYTQLAGKETFVAMGTS
jgi:hypothetical protein